MRRNRRGQNPRPQERNLVESHAVQALQCIMTCHQTILYHEGKLKDVGVSIYPDGEESK